MMEQLREWLSVEVISVHSKETFYHGYLQIGPEMAMSTPQKSNMKTYAMNQLKRITLSFLSSNPLEYQGKFVINLVLLRGFLQESNYQAYSGTK